ncbi:uncharacterized protein ACIBXB_021532 [Morphnus guianensis]
METLKVTRYIPAAAPAWRGPAPLPLRASDTDPAVLLGAFPGTRRAIAQPRHGARVHHRGHKGDFFQREDRVIKSKVHYLLLSFRKRWSCLWVDLTRIPELQFCFLDLPGTSRSRRLELQHYTLTGNAARSFASRGRWFSPRIPRRRPEFDRRSISSSLTRKVPSGSPKPLPKSGIKLLNTNVKLSSGHFVYRSAGDTGDRSSKGVSHLVSKPISFYRLFLSRHCYISSFHKKAYYARSQI